MKITFSLLLCFRADAPAAIANDHTPRLLRGSVPRGIAGSRSGGSCSRIVCAQLHVLEDRRQSAGNEVKLFIVRVTAALERGNPPLLYVSGGPGDAASSAVWAWLAADMHKARDIIFVDQRGSGRSTTVAELPRS